jgi:O-antigen/teichoic acid export membrane protein
MFTRLNAFDATGDFRPTAAVADLRIRAVRGAGVMILFQTVTIAIQVIATVVLARLLAPADFGVVSMVTTFSLLFQNFGVNGFTEAVVQREKLNDALASNLFWINLGTGVLLTAVFAASGSLMARFYGNPLVARVAVGISVNILVTSTSVLHLGLLRRAMWFTAVSTNDLLARGVYVITSVLLGWAGWGYWALVVGAITQSLFTSAGAWILCRWVPRPPSRVAGTFSMIRFATHVYGFFGLNYAKNNLDNLLIASNFGAGALGLYKKAFDLFYLAGTQLFAPMSAAAVPALSRIANDRETYRQFLVQSFAMLAFVGMGLGACLTLVGNDLVIVLLGSKWVEAGKIFQFFAPGIGAVFLYGPWGWIPLSIGRAERYSRWGLVELVVTALLFFVAIPWGVKGIAAAWSASYWLLALPATWYAGRPIGFGVGQVLEAVWKYILAAVAAAGLCFLLIPRAHFLFLVAGTTGNIVRIVTISVIFAALYLGISILLHGGLEPVRQFTRLLPDLVPRLKFLKPPLDLPASAQMARAATANGASPNTREIAALAHQLWIERGRPEGSREKDWTRAERELQDKQSS